MELPNSTLPPRRRSALATEKQLDYIEFLLDKLDADLRDYTDTPVANLTAKEASDIIDMLKDDITDADLWDDDF